MSKNIIVTLAVGAICTAVGFVIGSKWTEKNIREDLDELYTKEFEMIKKDYEKKHGINSEESKETESNAEAEMAEEAKKMQEGVKKARENRASKNEDASEVVDKKPNRYHPDIETCYEKEEDVSDIYEDKGPYMISYEEFFTNKDYSEKSMTWDVDHAILTYDDNPSEVIEDIDELVSYEALDILESSKTNEIYVRNDSLKTDFVISRYVPN